MEHSIAEYGCILAKQFFKLHREMLPEAVVETAAGVCQILADVEIESDRAEK